jgi:hypothetical protein
MSARIGIFWVYKTEVLGVTAPLTEGIDNGVMVDGFAAHVDEWPRIRARYRGRFPELVSFDYLEIPRGRVLFDKQRDLFRCYMDSRLHKPEIRSALLQEFGLAGARVQFESDPHYTTDPEEQERLFND